MSFLAGQIVTADQLTNLATEGTYTPALTATTTDPNLGADGSTDGQWHRNGFQITAYVIVILSGTGIDFGSGDWEVSLPFGVNTSLMQTASVPGLATAIGSGSIRRAVSTGSAPRQTDITIAPTTATTAGMYMGAQTSTLDTNYRLQAASPILSSATTLRLAFFATYLADPAGLP
jgi:hypothetical protein